MPSGHPGVTTPPRRDRTTDPVASRGTPLDDSGVHDESGVQDALDRLGDRWSALVLVELAAASHRFRDLQRSIPGISHRVLTLTVRRLERDGLVSRTVSPTVPAQAEYELTARGRSLTRLVRQLADWSLAHRDAVAASRAAWEAAQERAAQAAAAPGAGTAAHDGRATPTP